MPVAVGKGVSVTVPVVVGLGVMVGVCVAVAEGTVVEVLVGVDVGGGGRMMASPWIWLSRLPTELPSTPIHLMW